MTGASAIQTIDPSVWIAPSAQIFGRVTIARDASVWHNVVMRAECGEISIGRMTNIQDFVMIHVGYDDPTRIGDFCSITHRAVVHGATVEDDCLIGIGAVVMDGAVIGRGSSVAPGAVVTERTVIPPGSIAAGVPARVIKSRDCARENRGNAWNYWWNAQAYARGEHRAWEGEAFRRFTEAKRRSEGGD